MLADLYAYTFNMLGKEQPSIESFCSMMNETPQNETFIGIYRKLTPQETDILYYEYALSVSLADIIKNDMESSVQCAAELPGGIFALFLAKHLLGSGAALVVALVMDEFNATEFGHDNCLIFLPVDGALCWCVAPMDRRERAANVLNQPFNVDKAWNFDLRAWVPGSEKAN
jgi:hypothetical protein